MSGRQVRLELEPRAECVDDLQDEVARLWEAVPSVGARDRMRFEMAVVEIFANIVQHGVAGTEGREPRRVGVDLDVTDAELTARFVDDGRPADIDLHDVTMPAPEAEEGRGLALTLATVDHLEYQRDGGSNQWTITCRRSG